jgi:hypothetical protein
MLTFKFIILKYLIKKIKKQMSEESDFSDDGPIGWIQWFCSLEDHQFLC